MLDAPEPEPEPPAQLNVSAEAQLNVSVPPSSSAVLQGWEAGRGREDTAAQTADAAAPAAGAQKQKAGITDVTPARPSAARQEIDALYQQHTPEKLGDVDGLSVKYGEAKLLAMVRKKYKVAAAVGAVPKKAHITEWPPEPEPTQRVGQSVEVSSMAAFEVEERALCVNSESSSSESEEEDDNEQASTHQQSDHSLISFISER